MTTQSHLELTLLSHIRALGLPEPERQFRFHPPRRWRFDFAWPDQMIAVECEGGIWSRGRHVRGKGFEADCEKLNQAVLLGWRVLRFTSNQIDSGKALVVLEKILVA